MTTVDFSRLKKLLKDAVTESLEFIINTQPKSKLPTQEYSDIEVNLDAHEWVAHTKQFFNVDGWKEKKDLLSSPRASNLVDYLLDKGFQDIYGYNNQYKPSDTFIVDGERGYVEVNIYQRFLNSYINRCGLTFDQTCYDGIFEELKNDISDPQKAMRILILRNFNLKGINELNVLGYKIRPLTGFEINALIRVGAYNGSNMTTMFRIPDGSKGELNPAFCMEIPSIIFPSDYDESSDADYIRVKVLGFLLLYEDFPISCNGELTYRHLLLNPAQTGFGAIKDYNELTRNYAPGLRYVLDQSGVTKLKEFEEKYSRVDFRAFSSFKIALSRYISSIFKHNYEDILIDLFIALESLLANGNTEISYKLSLMAACFSDEDPKEREIVFDLLKKAYSVRSKIVHGDSSDLKKALAKMKAYNIESVYQLDLKLRELLLKIMRRIIDRFGSSLLGNGGVLRTKEDLINFIDNKILDGF